MRKIFSLRVTRYSLRFTVDLSPEKLQTSTIVNMEDA